jgi:hypothetical protein
VKEGIHPKYRPVVFLDTSSGFSFLTRSTVKTDETVEWKFNDVVFLAGDTHWPYAISYDPDHDDEVDFYELGSSPLSALPLASTPGQGTPPQFNDFP